MTGGATAAGGTYQRAHVTAAGFDTNSGETVDAGGAVGVQGRAASGVIRDQARAVGAATAGLGGSPAGARLIMATMDQHLEAMQRQLDQTTAQNRLLALRLRQLAAGYRGMGSPGVGGMPLSGLGGLMGGAGGGGGGLSGLSGLGGVASGIPATLMSSLTRGGAGGQQGGSERESVLAGDGRGSGTALRAVQYAETKLGDPYVWGAVGPRTYDCSGLVMDSYAHAGVHLPRMTYDMIHHGTLVDRADVRAGDLVFSNFSSRGPEHVQLAVSSTKVIEAPTPGGHVQYSNFPHGRVVVKRIVG
ncbi:NlpC/P60 family protein (plasmid) [Mycobacterium europaeum]|uniref:Putative secreted protein P60-like protein n=1 Tax=Mycobacterium intracellulare subsp. chimaera TaxID=222805 RepID=A0A7U5RXZ8_MYCIT|nr:MULTISPECIES: NlpC/P60 family protein [Mycobacterium]ASL18148.1 putative secreted protein P60-like protein [Mycobacterium intracellulare subsp. chimaera]